MGESERSKRGPQVMDSQLELVRGWQRFPDPQHSSILGCRLGESGLYRVWPLCLKTIWALDCSGHMRDKEGLRDTCCCVIL